MKDVLGVMCSGLCIAHCLLVPIALVLGVPIVGLTVFLNEEVHLGLVLIAVLLAMWSFPSGWKVHGQWLPSVLASIAVVSVVLMLILPESVEVYSATVAASFFIFAHIVNRRFLYKLNA